MAEPSEKLANSLEILKTLQDQGRVAIRSRDLTRTHRERLLKNGFLKEVIRGWYIPSRPDEAQGESTAWYAGYWDFLKDYLTERYGTDWSLSPEQSLLLHAGNLAVPRQLLIRSPKGSNNTTDFPFETSLVDVRQDTPKNADMTERDGLRLYALDAGLVSASPNFFRRYPNEARALLAALPDTSRLLARLLDGGHSAIAGRLAGALRSIGRERAADEIVKAMKAADYDVREADPFEQRIEIGGGKRAESPYVLRLQLMWEAMRQDVMDTLYRYASCDIDAKERKSIIETPWKQSEFHFISCLALKPAERKRLIAFAPSNKMDFHEWLPHDYTDGPYLGELGLRDTWPRDFWEFRDTRTDRNEEFELGNLAVGYLWESHLDGSLPEGANVYVPHPWLVQKLGLKPHPTRPGIYIDQTDEPTVITGREEKNSYCLVRRAKLMGLLDEQNLKPVWTLIGERMAWWEGDTVRGKRVRFNGMLWLEGKRVRNETWSHFD